MKTATVMMRVPVEFQRLVQRAAHKHHRSAVEQLRMLVGYVRKELARYPKL